MAQDAVVLNKRDIARFQKRLNALQAFAAKLSSGDTPTEPVKRRRRRRRKAAATVVRRRRRAAAVPETAPALATADGNDE